MKFNKNLTRFTKGFTLIELLVVIAIIGILSSIVLASLSTARSKANDSKVQEQLSGLRSAAEIYNSTNSGYTDQGVTAFVGNAAGSANTAACSAGTGATFTGGTGTWANDGVFLADTNSGALGIMVALAATNGVTMINCAATPTTWAVIVNLPSGGSTGATDWCVDSAGKSKAEGNATALTAGICS